MQPNIIVLVIDSLRLDHVGVYSQSIAAQRTAHLTPNLDALAREGIVFEQAISQGPSTPPAVKALMTSTYPREYDGPSSRLSASRSTVARYLRDAGYATAGITSNEYLSAARGWSRDFDHYDDCPRNPLYQQSVLFRGMNQIAKRLGTPLEQPVSLPAEILFPRAADWLKKTKQPSFLWIQTMDVHWPYRLQRFTINPAWQVQQRHERKRIRPRLISDAPVFTATEHKKLLDQYRRAVRHSDEQVGLFLQELRRQGRLDNTIIFVLADHGEEFGEHGRYFHSAHLYDVLVHVPLIVYLPPSLRVRQNLSYLPQVRLIDLAPTLLDISGTPAPAHFRGHSLLPILRGEYVDTAAGKEEDRPAFIESFSMKDYSLRWKGWKYMLNTETGQGKLFHLRQDPEELHDRQEDRPDVLAEFRSLLLAHVEQYPAAGTAESDSAVDEIGLDEEEILVRLRDLGYVE